MGYNLSGYYKRNMSSTEWATTQVIDCNVYTDVRLGFYRWLGVEGNSRDHAYIEVSNDGSNWVEIWSNPSSMIIDTSWQYVEYDISAVADGSATVYVRWGIGPTNNNKQYSGWNIDDVSVIGRIQTQIAVGDFEPDCDVDSFDFEILVNAWLSGPGDDNWCLPCDMSEPNDIIDFRDFGVFTDSWVEGF